MKQSIFPKSKSKYVSPRIDVIRFSAADIITNSPTGGDPNQGEWDPVSVSDSGTIRWGDMK
ncbi:MAG: hypothetical protein IKV00_05050 [Clostridia bacterium]|nr:hypothetical protein [Clostridia bacterium]